MSSLIQYEIAKPDGSRVDDQGMILTATLKGESYSGGSTTLETVDVPVPTDGTVSVSVQVPAEIADYYMLSLDSMVRPNGNFLFDVWYTFTHAGLVSFHDVTWQNTFQTTC